MNNFIIPENLGKKTIDFLDEYAQWLTDIANAKLFEESLDMIERGELEKDDLIREYEKLKDEFQESVGFEDKKKSSNTKEYLGKCIACKSGLVYETEKTFRCNNYGCNFTLFKSSFTLLEKNGRYIPEVNHKDYIKALLEAPRKRIYFEGLKSSKGKEFNAYLTIKRVDKGDKTYWNFAFSFPKKDVSENTLREEQILASNEIHIEADKYSNQSIESNKENGLLEKLKRLEEENRLLKDAHLKDALTRAYNRKALESDLEVFVKRQLEIGLAFLDADHFKRINDTYGHQVGDEVLCKIVDTVFESIRGLRARVYRYGGEEFVVMAAGMSEYDFNKILQKIRISISKVEFFANNTNLM